MESQNRHGVRTYQFHRETVDSSHAAGGFVDAAANRTNIDRRRCNPLPGRCQPRSTFTPTNAPTRPAASTTTRAGGTQSMRRYNGLRKVPPFVEYWLIHSGSEIEGSTECTNRHYRSGGGTSETRDRPRCSWQPCTLICLHVLRRRQTCGMTARPMKPRFCEFWHAVGRPAGKPLAFRRLHRGIRLCHAGPAVVHAGLQWPQMRSRLSLKLISSTVKTISNGPSHLK